MKLSCYLFRILEFEGMLRNAHQFSIQQLRQQLPNSRQPVAVCGRDQQLDQ